MLSLAESPSGENEFGRLFQGFGKIEGMDMLEFIRKSQVPPDKKVTHPRCAVAVRPEKDEPLRTRITAGGDRLQHDGETMVNTASMETIKCHWNSVLSSPGAKCCAGDVSSMCLCSAPPDAQLVRFKAELIPPRAAEHRNLQGLIHNGFVCAKIKKAWCGLKEAGKIAHDDLVERLAKRGHRKCERAEGLFKHESRDTSFALVVDDFGIKHKKMEDVEHLKKVIGEHHPFKVDMEAKQHVGTQLKWNRSRRALRCSMPGHVQQALEELQHVLPNRHHCAPSAMERPDCGASVQHAKEDLSKPLDETAIKRIQKVTGKFLCCARAIDNAVMHSLNEIAIATTRGTEKTMKAAVHFLNCAASNPDAETLHRASDMILRVESDAACLVAPQARSRMGGSHHLSTEDGKLFNGPILVIAKVIKNVMASAAEAEVAALFSNAQEAAAIRTMPDEMGHPQPPAPIKTDNSTATGIINGTIKQKRSKAIDMRFCWLKDRVEQNQFKVCWDAGEHNLADCPTEHHSGEHHKQWRPTMLNADGKSPETLQGCVEIMTADPVAGSPGLPNTGQIS